MHSQKFRVKSDVLEKVEIKKEKVELYPMQHYIDDRVELVKQIFASLKPKTIKNLAPDFLKDATIEDIEELCLNELLGISTKRLTSIISATKCPTDTESSDSDVNNIEEHISLEEISSDSEAEKAAKAKKVPEKRRKKKGEPINPQENNKTAKEISVLELLELQARARAIRSQLALEPIAKIEVDSDDSEKSDVDNTKVLTKSNQSNEKSEDNKVKKRLQSDPVNGDATIPSGSTTTKRIKLKRNFRRRNVDSEHDERIGNEKEKSPNPVESTPKNSSEIKTEKSPSPDVITILPSPETLCISDSSEDEVENKETSSANTQQEESKELEKPAEIENEEDKIESEVEDGEILEKEEDALESKEELLQTDERVDEKQQETCDSLEANVAGTSAQMEAKSGTVEKEDASISKDDNSLEKSTDNNEDNPNDDVISLEHEELDYEMKEDEKCEQQRESIVDMPIELSNSPKVPAESNSQRSDEKICDNFDYIELHDDSSENENENDDQKDKIGNEQSQSWNSRWLQSSKVSKILAASRLGNRVRDKIKQSKKIVQAIAERKIEASASPKVQFSSKFEEGSMQQYREILEREKLNLDQDNIQ